MTNAEYKRWLIEEILNDQTEGKFTREYLEKRSIRALEVIYDNLVLYEGRA